MGHKQNKEQQRTTNKWRKYRGSYEVMYFIDPFRVT